GCEPCVAKLFNAGPSRPLMFRPWRSFPTMVASGLVLGFVTGGFPAYSKEISQLALAVGMAFSLSEITLKGISPRDELRGFLISFALSYVLFSGVVLAFAFARDEPVTRAGWVLLAA